MKTKEKKELQKTPAKVVREMYVQLVDEIRQCAKVTCILLPFLSGIYLLGWRDGYNARRHEKGAG